MIGIRIAMEIKMKIGMGKGMRIRKIIAMEDIYPPRCRIILNLSRSNSNEIFVNVLLCFLLVFWFFLAVR